MDNFSLVNGSSPKDTPNSTPQTEVLNADTDAGNSNIHDDKSVCQNCPTCSISQQPNVCKTCPTCTPSQLPKEDATVKKDHDFDEVFAAHVQLYGREKVREMVSDILKDADCKRLPQLKDEKSTSTLEMDFKKLNLPDDVDRTVLESGLKDLKVLANMDKYRDDDLNTFTYNRTCHCIWCADRHMENPKELFETVS